MKNEYFVKDVIEDLLFNMKRKSKYNTPLLDNKINIINELEDDEKEYIKLAKMKRLYNVRVKNSISGVDGEIFVYHYDNNLNRKKFFAELEETVCPICTVKVSKTLDHYLPKSKFPQFSLTPSNLIIMCGDCNKEKSEHFATDYISMPLHPNFEKIDFISYLIIINNKHKLEFGIVKNVDTESLRYKYNFYEIYKLNLQLNTLLNVELNKMKEMYHNTFASNYNGFQLLIKRRYFDMKKEVYKSIDSIYVRFKLYEYFFYLNVNEGEELLNYNSNFLDSIK